MDERLAHIKGEMQKRDIDILIATTPENVTYTTGFRSVTHQMLKGTLIFSVISKDKKIPPVMILPIGEADRLFDMNKLPGEILTFGNFNFVPGEKLTPKDKRYLKQIENNKWKENAFDILLSTVKERYGENLRIGIDERGLTYSEYNLIKEKLSESEVFEAFNIFKEIRTIKTKEEIKKIKTSVKITEEALLKTIESIKESVEEVELQKIFEKELIENNALPAFTLIGFGANGAYPNAKPSNRKLKKGELVRFDLGCTYECYYSDIARTAIVGTPSEKQQKYYDAIVEGQQEILDNIRDGAIASELFDIGVKTVKKTIKEYERHHVGHGIGIEVYDYPILAPWNTMKLKEDMTMCIETPFYEFGFGGLQIEDEIVVTKNGYKMLTSIDRDLFVL